MAVYRFNEGRLSVPDDWRDESLHVLKPKDTVQDKTSFVILRDRTGFGESLEAFCERQIGQLKNSLADFSLKNSVAMGFPALQGRSAQALEFTWTNPEGKMHQIVVMFEPEERPGDEGSLPAKVLVLTATCIGQMDQELRERFVEIMRTLELRVEGALD